MQKIGIKIIDLNEATPKNIAKALQSYIIEGDYALSSIIYQIQNREIVVLDVSNEENMPQFLVTAEDFDEEDIKYELYALVDGEWEKKDIDDFGLDRTPKWLVMTIGLVVIGYFVMAFFEIFAIYDWFTIKYELGGVISTIGAIITSIIPIAGSLFAYWTATEIWHWSSLFSFLLYFWYYIPIVGFILYFTTLLVQILYTERWYRFRYPEFN